LVDYEWVILKEVPGARCCKVPSAGFQVPDYGWWIPHILRMQNYQMFMIWTINMTLWI